MAIKSNIPKGMFKYVAVFKIKYPVASSIYCRVGWDTSVSFYAPTDEQAKCLVQTTVPERIRDRHGSDVKLVKLKSLTKWVKISV